MSISNILSTIPSYCTPLTDIVELKTQKIKMDHPYEAQSQKILTIPFSPTICNKKLAQRTTSVEYKFQKDFIINRLHKRIVECGSSGDCLIYSILRQIEDISDQEFEKSKQERMEELRENVHEYAQKKCKSYKSKIRDKLKSINCKLQNHSSNSPIDQSDLQKEQHRYKALLKDVQKEEKSIKDLGTCSRSLDICYEEGKYLSAYLKRPIIVFSEHNLGTNQNMIGSFCCRRPNGKLTSNRYKNESSLPANAILIYHNGNDKGGHYQAIM